MCAVPKQRSRRRNFADVGRTHKTTAKPEVLSKGLSIARHFANVTSPSGSARIYTLFIAPRMEAAMPGCMGVGCTSLWHAHEGPIAASRC